MTLANPAGLLLLALLPVIVLFHLRRPVRRTVTASTLRFWSNIPNTSANAHAPARRLHRSPSLLLQLLAAALAALAFADPRITMTEQGRSRVSIIVDNSASTTAIEDGNSRFAAIREQAKAVISELQSSQKAILVSAATPPKIVATLTNNQEALLRALESIQPVARAADVAGAIALSTQILSSEPPATLHVFADANAKFKSGSDADVDLHWHLVGRRLANTAITAFEIRKSATPEAGYQAFLALTNASDTPSKFGLRLSVDADTIYNTEIELAGRGARTVVVPLDQTTSGTVKAAIDADDPVSIDDTAYAYLPPSKPTKVLLVSEGNFFLEAALRANTALTVESVTPGVLEATPRQADVVILDRVEAQQLADLQLPPANYLLIRSLPDFTPIRQIGTLETVSTLTTDTSHPIGKYLDLANVIVKSALKVRPTGDCSTPVEALHDPMIVTCSTKSGRVVFIAFDLLQSELPLRAGMPILLDNTLRWLSSSNHTAPGTSVRSGEMISAEFGTAAETAEVVRPDGQRVIVPLSGRRFSYSDTDLPGIYTATSSGQIQTFAVNMLDERESDLWSIQQPPENVPAKKNTHEANIPIWPFLVALTIIIIAAEFFYYLSAEQRRPPVFASTCAALAIGLLIAALLKPSIDIVKSAASTIVAIDISDSIPPDEKRKALASAVAATKAAGPEDNVEILQFAGRAGPSEATPQSDSTTTAEHLLPLRTDISNALGVALGRMPMSDARRIVLLSDGNENSGGDSPPLQQIANGVAIYPVPLDTRPADDIIIERIDTPNTVRRGEAFTLQIFVWSAKPEAATLTLKRDGTVVRTEQVRLDRGRNIFRIKEASDTEHIQRYSASISPVGTGSAPVATAEAAVGIRGQARVLIISGDEARARTAADALRAQHFDVDVIPGEKAASGIERINEYDTLILDNTPSSSLGETSMTAIQRYVSEDGGGLIMLGGEKSFGLGGYAGTPIEDLLPVTMTPRGKIELPSQAIVLVIDRSGSMSTKQAQRSRIDLAKQAAQESIAMLPEEAEVGVLTFDTEADWIVPIAPAKNRDLIQRDISSIDTGGGGTELLVALKEAHQALRRKSASLKHIIVLSDGEAPEKHFKELLHEIDTDRISVSTIAISSEAGRNLLQKIADWGGGRYYYTNNLYALPRILTTETRLASDKGLNEESFRPSIGRRSSEILKGVAWSSAPELHGYVKTTPKPSAEPLLTSPAADPVLTVGYSGIGRTAAFTSDFSGQWGKNWLTWPDFPRFIGQFVRWTNRATPTNLQPRISIAGSQGQLALEAFDRQGRHANFLRGDVGIIYPDASRKVFSLRQIGPGRYEAAFDAEASGLYLAAISIEPADDMPMRSAVAQYFLPHLKERTTSRANHPLLHRLADMSGGHLLQHPQDIHAIPASSSRTVSAWPWAILSALALFLIQIAARWLMGIREGRRMTKFLSSENLSTRQQPAKV